MSDVVSFYVRFYRRRLILQENAEVALDNLPLSLESSRFNTRFRGPARKRDKVSRYT